MKKGIDYVGVAVVYACHDGEGNYLLNKRSAQCRDEHGRWDIGGGALEFGSTAEDTLRKEISEEYTTSVIKYDFLGYRDNHREVSGVATHWVSLDFRVLVDRSLVTNGEPHKFDEIGWYRLDTFPQPLHSLVPAFLLKYHAKL